MATNKYLKISNPLHSIVAVIFLFLFAYFQLFYNLDKLPLRVWDEAKNAVSAYEMLNNNNYLVRHYEGQPDGWGFKPPFLTWNQVISMKIFGINDYAVRFPSALYALFTSLLIFFFFKNHFQKPFIGLLAGLILLTSFGYLKHHIARYGDHDSILVFFLTLQTIYFCKYINDENNQHKNLAIFTLGLILASFTKGVAGLFFVPGFVLYTFINRKLKYVFLNPKVYLYFSLYLLFIGGYYFLRELDAPGYLRAVWENELLPRYTNNASNYTYEHTSDYFFYVRNLWNERLVPWIYTLPVLLAILSFSKYKKIKILYHYLLVISISFLVIISGGSKGIWYDAPIFPLLAIALALGIFQLYLFFKKIPLPKYVIILGTLLILSPFLYAGFENTKKLTFKIKERHWNHELPQGISYFLRDNSDELKQFDELGIAYRGYRSHIRFYVNIAVDNGHRVSFVNYKNIKTPTIVIASEKKVKDYIEQNYKFEKELKDYGTVIYKIKKSNKL